MYYEGKFTKTSVEMFVKMLYNKLPDTTDLNHSWEATFPVTRRGNVSAIAPALAQTTALYNTSLHMHCDGKGLPLGWEAIFHIMNPQDRVTISGNIPPEKQALLEARLDILFNDPFDQLETSECTDIDWEEALEYLNVTEQDIKEVEAMFFPR